MNALTQIADEPIPDAVEPDVVDIAPIALSLPAATSYPDWIGIGRSLANSKRNIDWLIGDWIGFGREHFPDQIALDMPDLPGLLETAKDVAGDASALKRIEKTVKAFPPHLRDMALSFDHHAHIADLPTQDALPLLAQAHTGKWSAKQLKVAATLRKIELGQQTMWDDKDVDYTELLSIVRAWNSAQPHIREQFIELASTAKLGIIEA